MPTMTKKWTPDPETAEIFATYAAAVRTERDLKPDVRERAEAALKAGATGTQLSRLTGMTPEVFRRMARDLQLPVDPRYRERAEASRRKPRPQAVAQPAPVPNERPSPKPTPLADHRADVIAALTDQQAAELAVAAFPKADRDQYRALEAASADGDRAVIAAALDLGVLTETELLIA